MWHHFEPSSPNKNITPADQTSRSVGQPKDPMRNESSAKHSRHDKIIISLSEHVGQIGHHILKTANQLLHCSVLAVENVVTE